MTTHEFDDLDALTEARADADFLRRLATQVIAIGTLAPGEELAEPTEHAVIDTALRLRRERDEARARLEKAEAEARGYRYALIMIKTRASGINDALDWSQAALTSTRERREGESGAPAALSVERALLRRWKAMAEHWEASEVDALHAETDALLGPPVERCNLGVAGCTCFHSCDPGVATHSVAQQEPKAKP